MAKNNFYCKLAICLVLTSCQFEKVKEVYSAPLHLETEQSKTIYTLGRIIGIGIEKYQLSADDLAVLAQGIRDQVSNKKSEVDIALYEKKLNELLSYKRADKVAHNIIATNKFLEKLEKEQGFIKQDKLYLKIEKQGQKLDVEVLPISLKLIGLARQGVEMFEKQEVKLSALVPGLQEAIKLMGLNAKGRVAFDHTLGFGIEGAGNIEGGEGLYFELETFKP